MPAPLLVLAAMAVQPATLHAAPPAPSNDARLRLEPWADLGLGLGAPPSPLEARMGLDARLKLGRGTAVFSSFASAPLGVAPGATPTAPWVEDLSRTISPTAGRGMRVGAGIGYGLYLGNPTVPRGELFVFYDQALKRRLVDPASRLPKQGGGRFGLRGTLFLSEELGLVLGADVGSSWSVGLSLVYRPNCRWW